jgi:hypothetical protein
MTVTGRLFRKIFPSSPEYPFSLSIRYVKRVTCVAEGQDDRVWECKWLALLVFVHYLSLAVPDIKKSYEKRISTFD